LPQNCTLLHFPGSRLTPDNGDILEQNRQAASYADQILHGANLAELPVEAPKFKTFVDLKTARTLDLYVLPLMLVDGPLMTQI
jgi:hypothetical protein